MKKISVAVLAAAMLAGTVTAADVSFSYKGSNYFRLKSQKLTYQATGSDTNWRNGGTSQYLRADCLSVGLNTDMAGVYIDYDTSAGSLALDEYYGWMNFTLPVGSLQVTTGAWNGRYVNRVVADKYNLDGAEFELYKPGVINGTVGYDSDNLTLGNLGLVGAWTIADALPGTLMVKLGMVSYHDANWNHNRADKWATGSYNKTTAKDTSKTGKVSNSISDWLWNPDADTWFVKAGFAGEVAYRQEGAFAANLAVRVLNKYSYSFGAWVSPEVSDTLQLTVGGTVATAKFWNEGDVTPTGDGLYFKDDADGNPIDQSGTLTYSGGEWSDRKWEYGIDFRMRLQVTDDLSLTTMNNLSAGYGKNGVKSAKTGMLWNMLNATYAFADNLKASFTVQSEADVFCPVVNDDDAEWNLIVSPSLIIQASERVRVTTSARAYIPNVRNYAFKNIMFTVPVIFSFNY